jgi:radical SAM protein with 4Fe4S-binding SPASM domain
MMREHSFGNVKYEEIYNILGNKEKEIKNFWQFTLDKIEGCSSCEFRYACTDCRSLEEHLTGRLDGKRTCSYNPREGKWLMRGNESKNQSAA